jgi:hypothetical protein
MMLIIIGTLALYSATLLPHVSHGHTNNTFYNSSRLLCCQRFKESTEIGTVSLNTKLTKDNAYSNGVGDLRYFLNPAATSIHLSDYPNLHYVLSPEQAWLSVFTDGDLYLNAHFGIQTASDGQRKLNSSMQAIPVSAFTRYDLRHHLFTPGIGTSTYDTEPGFLVMGASHVLSWSNAKVKLKTFDNGTGIYSLIA